jgi:hypothetical protein
VRLRSHRRAAPLHGHRGEHTQVPLIASVHRVADTPGFESSEEMISEARAEIETPIDEDALLAPAHLPDDEPLASAPHQAVSSPPRAMRRAAAASSRARIIAGLLIALVAMGIAVAAALLASGH